MKMRGERNSEPDIILLKIIQSEQQREKRLEKRISALGNGLSLTKDRASHSPESWNKLNKKGLKKLLKK